MGVDPVFVVLPGVLFIPPVVVSADPVPVGVVVVPVPVVPLGVIPPPIPVFIGVVAGVVIPLFEGVVVVLVGVPTLPPKPPAPSEPFPPVVPLLMPGLGIVPVMNANVCVVSLPLNPMFSDCSIATDDVPVAKPCFRAHAMAWRVSALMRPVIRPGEHPRSRSSCCSAMIST
jgi:hypothetical protein